MCVMEVSIWKSIVSNNIYYMYHTYMYYKYICIYVNICLEDASSSFNNLYTNFSDVWNLQQKWQRRIKDHKIGNTFECLIAVTESIILTICRCFALIEHLTKFKMSETILKQLWQVGN